MHRMTDINITDLKGGEFWHALAEASKGDRIVYHSGEHCGGPHRRDASKAHAEGSVMLFCRRAENGSFDYLAVKR